MISAGPGVMGSDNSNGSAHKHLAQFTLSNAPRSPTLSSCLSVRLLTQPTGSPKIHLFSLLCQNPCFCPPLSLYLTICFVHFFFFLVQFTDKHPKHPFNPPSRPFYFKPNSYSAFLLPTPPSPSRHLLLPRHYKLFFFCFTLLSFSPLLSHSPFPSSSCPPPTKGCLNRWLVAGCCCALLVGLQEAAYLSV